MSITGFRPALVATAALAFLAAPASPQDERVRHDVVVRVVDEVAGSPVVGAAVMVAGRDRIHLTDDDGRVVVRGLEGEFSALHISLLGYAEVIATIPVGEGVGVQTIELPPQPVLLEGVQVQTNRLRARRNAVGTSVRAFDRQQLITSAARDVGEFLRNRVMLRPAPCPGGPGPHTCAIVRGRAQPVRVYIDEIPLFGGLDFLDSYDPHEMYLVEVYGGGSQIRAYTNFFMEKVARGRAFIAPVLW